MKLSDKLNTSLYAYKQQQRFDDSKDIKKERGSCVVKKIDKGTKINRTLEDLIGSLNA